MSRTLLPHPTADPDPARADARPPAAARSFVPRAFLRWAAAALLVVAAAVHIPVIPGHLHEAPYIGALFIALTAVCCALAAAVLLPRGDRPAVWAASGAVCAAAVGAYLLSRSVALPQIGDDVGAWTDPLGLAAIASEAVVTVLAAVALVRRRPA